MNGNFDLAEPVKCSNPSDIQSIKEWLTKQPHLPDVSDRQIAIFLHSCYDRLELTKATIDYYYTIRTRATDIFGDRRLDQFARTMDIVYGILMSSLTPEKHKVMAIGFLVTDASKFDTVETIRLGLALLDLFYNLHPNAEGWRIVMNAKGFSFGHFTNLTVHLSAVRSLLCYVQDGLPIRLKGIHIINAIPLVNQFLALIKPMMKKELYELIHVHSDEESLHKIIPWNCLPSDYDGRNNSESIECLQKRSAEMLEKFEDWFVLDERRTRVNEAKRIIRDGKTSDDNFGIVGSFKKLDLD